MANMLRNLFKKSPLIRKLKWELEYLIGTWKFLDSSMEAARYEVIIGFMKQYCHAMPSILEMGCGEGLLQSKMKDFEYSSVTGVDLSNIAIRKAIARKFNHSTYQVANMDSWTSDKKFDVIIFNESIYFSKDPVALMGKYSQWLRDDGRMIVSIYIMDPTQIVVDNILAAYQPLAFQEVRNEMGVWHEYIFAFGAGTKSS